ncbi:META domain-containing protein [Aureitalea marina]|uniref:DUF306 domain-containing protein n=1 Tax=Aureitalea marina TaxID=930804 RepID=A0A2S7KSN2_9FLAO|nr:META domain-containing protein [Aureitalea marina]PQB05626.1 hypothetical protein BST85_12500 [Aureitalea marina]
MDANKPLAGEFIVQSVQGKLIPENIEVNFALDTVESKVSGKSACNNFFGAYLSEGEELSFAKLASTMMACPEEQMELEQQFLSTMELVGSYRWSDDKLELLDAEDQSVLIVAASNANQ